VAMTRASERMILTHCIKKAENALQKAAFCGYPADPYVAGLADSMGHWVLMAAMLRPEAGALRRAAGAGEMETIPVEGRWEIAFHTEVESIPTAVETAADTPILLPPVSAPLAQFVDAHAAAAATPSKLTATQLKGRYQDQEAAESAVGWHEPDFNLPRFDRPRFAMAQQGLTAAERGVAAHLFMQYADYARCADTAGVQTELQRLVREEFLTQEQADAVSPTTILRFFEHPMGQQVLSAAELLREFKFSILDDANRYYPEAGAGEEVLLQGVVDCAIVEPEGLTVIDFKTDRIRPGGEAARAMQYRGQLEAYAHALERITGKPVRRQVLWFFATGTMWEA